MNKSAPTMFEERRRHTRVDLALPGRYMLSDGSEYPCEVDNVSPIGISIKGERAGRFGERIVAYIQGLGRVEGIVVRRKIGWFALDIRATQNKFERLDDRIAWLAEHDGAAALTRREPERSDVWNEKTVLMTDDGREFEAELLDISIDGAAVLVDVELPQGAQVSLGDQNAYVLRCFRGGMAVTFEPTTPEMLAAARATTAA